MTGSGFFFNGWDSLLFVAVTIVNKSRLIVGVVVG